MKKLKLKLQDLNVSEVLTRSQLQGIVGGDFGSNCRIYYQSVGGPVIAVYTVSGTTCAEQISNCNQKCVDIVTSGQGYNCHYDSGCDGWGS